MQFFQARMKNFNDWNWSVNLRILDYKEQIQKERICKDS
jgi:hypothetical protein